MVNYLIIVRVHCNTQEANENVKSHLEETFEQIQYMDHANGRIMSILSHKSQVPNYSMSNAMIFVSC